MIPSVLEYHERSKHHLRRYALGPETLDWDNPPAPFRIFSGAPSIALPRISRAEGPLRAALQGPAAHSFARPSLPIEVSSLAALLQLSVGITAWKTQGPDRWAVRANPSSGNLHPVEAYPITQGVSGLANGVHHYRADEHRLELRAEWGAGPVEPRAWIALSSVMWREAWKYGERAFRYCQLDVGHAEAAFAYAASLFGWSLRALSHVGSETLGTVLGLDRACDLPRVRRLDTEREEPELILAIESGSTSSSVSARELRERAATATFHGRASVIDAHPMYTWPIVESTAVLTRFRDEEFPQGRDVAWGGPVAPPRLVASSDHPLAAAQLVQGRRSAQRFNAGFVLARQAFERLLKAASCPYSPSASDSGPPGTPLDGEVATQIHLVLFVHRVDSLEPGIYLVRRAGEPSDAGLGEPEPGEPEPGEPELGEPELGKPRLDVSEKPSGLLPCFEAHFPVRRVHDSSPELELFQVSPCASRELARISRLLHCQQEIAASCCFAVAMLADVARAAELCPAAYRDLHREAGRIGHSLYLQAELEGVRGTGIGCFLDEPVAEFLGLQNSPYRSIYHFSVGQAQLDPRIETAAVEAEDT